MKRCEDMIRDHLEAIRIEPEKELRAKVLADAETGIVPDRRAGRSLGLRTVILAAVIAALSLTTALAYGGEIVEAVRSLLPGTVTGEQEDSLTIGELWGDDVTVTATDLSGAVRVITPDTPVAFSMRIENNRGLKAVSGKAYGGCTSFSSAEEARLAAPFNSSEPPRYLPENLTVSEAIVDYFEDGTYADRIIIRYEDENGDWALSFSQEYVGPDAWAELRTVCPVQNVMIGDTEGLYMYFDGAVLYWIKDGIFYTLSGAFDLETMLAVAESVE